MILTLCHRTLDGIVDKVDKLNVSSNSMGLKHLKMFFASAEVASIIQECTKELQQELEIFQVGTPLIRLLFGTLTCRPDRSQCQQHIPSIRYGTRSRKDREDYHICKRRRNA